MFINGIAIFFCPYTIGEWWLNKIQEGNPILLLGHPLVYPRWESNPNLRFRKPPFYPLNYKGNISRREDKDFICNRQMLFYYFND